MKILLPGVVLLGSLCAPVLWAHHAAEGIISDDIWNMIDDNLLEADSPHIYFDPANPGNLMELDVDDETNRAVIVSTGIIEFTDDVLMDDAAGFIETEFSPVFDTTMSDMNSIPTGMMGYVVEAIVENQGITTKFFDRELGGFDPIFIDQHHHVPQVAGQHVGFIAG